jgi:predicted N-acetyltransferase YhbS
MKITIRNEEEKDYAQVEEITRTAFWNLYVPGAVEHYLVHTMRQHKDFIKELAFVVEVEGKVEGAIFYTHSAVVDQKETRHSTLTFGPVCIAPAWHRKGLGRQLITYSIKEAKKWGYPALIIMGYPYHYEPYRFCGGKKYGISMADGKFYTSLLVLPLYQGALDNISGYVELSPVFEINPEDVDEFDKTFPFKEKKFRESQIEFEVACVQLDE